jgi:signal transduction histidine kinase
VIAPADFRVVPAFADLADDELAWLAEACVERVLAPGQAASEEGDPADELYVILEGEMQFRQENAPDGRIFMAEAGEVTGILPFSRMESYPGTLRAMVPTRLASLHKDRFGEMFRRIPVLEQRFVSMLADRVREATRAEQSREKLMALGKLSAGLAHEMNNPAAAMRRGAAHLRERLVAFPRLTVNLAGCNLDPVQFSTLASLQERRTKVEKHQRYSPIETSDREEAVGAWLEEHGVGEAWVLAETFVSTGVSVEDLDALAEKLPERALPDSVAWLGAGLAADLMLRELEDASRRISELVASVKSYSHMDEVNTRADTDVHEGLESTLTMLGHRLREKNVRVERDYAPDLPHPFANAGELNQVWTNLVDNAIDAVAHGGRVTLRTWHRDGEVVVEVRDDGPGVNPDIQERIWEPFYTTKDVGQGTGLGLDIARRIVVRQHGGQISLTSRPGDTCFQVRIPIQPPAFLNLPEHPATPEGEVAVMAPAVSGDGR